MGGDLSARFHAGNRGILPPKFLICNIALNLALKCGQTTSNRENSRREPFSREITSNLRKTCVAPPRNFDAPISQQLPFSFISEVEMVNLHATCRPLVRLTL
jgi:hypothetical protein